jgi:PAS domain S-box
MLQDRSKQDALGQYYLANDISRAKLGILLVTIPTLAFIFNDLQFLGTAEELLYAIIAVRIGLLLTAAFTFIIICRLSSYSSWGYSSYEKTVFIYEIIMATGLTLISASRPQNFMAQSVLVILAVFIIYLVIPNRFLYQTTTAAILIIGDVIVTFFGTTTVESMFSIIISSSLALVIAGLSSWQLQKYRLNSFQEAMDREKTEESLRQSEERFAKAFHSSPAALIVTGASDGIIIDVNEAWLRLFEQTAEVIGHKTTAFKPYVNPEDREKMLTALYEQGSLRKTELSFITKTGKQITVIASADKINIRGEDYVLSSVIDITERKKAEENLSKAKADLAAYNQNLEKLVEEKTKLLRDAERLAAIGTTAGMVGHDIRNPLQAMISDIYLIKEEIASTPECKNKEELTESLVGLEENINYINKIVQDLQDYAKPICPEYSEANLSNIIARVFDNVRVPHSIKLSIKIAKDLEKLKTDPIVLQRAFSNLVTNAIQAMPEGGVLEITGHADENKIVMTVSDTGVGIPDEIKPKLFTPMMTTKPKGQGFGLAVSKRLIEAMKGTISFESEKGIGTKFIVQLPLTPSQGVDKPS